MTLKDRLDDPTSTLRRFYTNALPHHRAVCQRYRRNLEGRPMVGSAAVLATRAAPAAAGPRHAYGVVGHGVGVGVALLFAADPRRLVRRWHRHPLTGTQWAALDRFWQHYADTVDASVDALIDAGDAGGLAELATVAGLCDQLYRAGRRPGLPLLDLDPDATLEEVLALAQPDVLDDVRAVLTAAVPALAPLGAWRSGRAEPELSGAALVGAADPDLQVGATLVEVKASVSRTLPLASLLQVVSYVLLDLYDDLGIECVALFNGRYPTPVTWQFDELLTELGGPGTTRATLRSGLSELRA